MTQQNAVVGVFDSHLEAQTSIKELLDAGFDMAKLSIVGKDIQTEEHVIGFYQAGDRVKFWGKLGAFWGGFLGLLLGYSLFVVTGLGPLVVFGPMVSRIVGALEGAVVGAGLSALAAALYSIGIPESNCRQYEMAIQANKFLVITHGTGSEAASQARAILETSGAEHTGIHPEQFSGLVTVA